MTVIPALRVRERATLDHWTQAFGLRLHAAYPPEGDALDHAELELGGGWIMAGLDREEGVGQPPGTGSVYWVLGDAAAVDALHARAVAAGCASVRAPNDPPYGGRECSLRDREGNLWSFGTYRPA